MNILLILLSVLNITFKIAMKDVYTKYREMLYNKNWFYSQISYGEVKWFNINMWNGQY